MRVSSTRFRIPDVMVLARGAAREQIVSEPPLLCVEILSPEDRIGRMEEKLAEYFEMGVRAVWVIDPATEAAYECLGPRVGDWRRTQTLRVAGTEIAVEVNELIADLD